MSPGNPFILVSKVKGPGHESQKTFPLGSLHYCECWLRVISSFYLLTLC